MALYCSKKLPALYRGITSKHHSGFYCLNCLHSFRTENKINKQVINKRTAEIISKCKKIVINVKKN